MMSVWLSASTTIACKRASGNPEGMVAAPVGTSGKPPEVPETWEVSDFRAGASRNSEFCETERDSSSSAADFIGAAIHQNLAESEPGPASDCVCGICGASGVFDTNDVRGVCGIRGDCIRNVCGICGVHGVRGARGIHAACGATNAMDAADAMDASDAANTTECGRCGRHRLQGRRRCHGRDHTRARTPESGPEPVQIDDAGRPIGPTAVETGSTAIEASPSEDAANLGAPIGLTL